MGDNEMDYKKKAKIEQTIFMILMMGGFAGIGAFVGAFLLAFEKSVGRKLTGGELFLSFVVAMAVIFLAYYVNLCLHETGHMIFGLMTGYKFSSLRFGKLMLVKRDGKLGFGIYNMPGTGGQCIMTAPEGDAENMPVVLYNLGGLIVNLIIMVLGFTVYFITKDSHLFAGMVGLTFALTAIVMLITNGLPFTQVGTDGANTIIMSKDKTARIAFRNQLEVVKYIADGKAIWEMPKELFDFDRSMPMTNPLITGQAVNCYNYLSGTRQYAEAKEMAQFILDNAKSINNLHEKILIGELIFLTAVIERDNEAAKELFKANEKDLKTAAGFISMQRILCAYYTLVEPDEKKAADFAKKFANTLKHYPYPKDAEMEKEQFDMIAALKAETE